MSSIDPSMRQTVQPGGEHSPPTAPKKGPKLDDQSSKTDQVAKTFTGRAGLTQSMSAAVSKNSVGHPSPQLKKSNDRTMKKLNTARKNAAAYAKASPELKFEMGVKANVLSSKVENLRKQDPQVMDSIIGAGADLKTAQGAKANRVAAQTQACLTAAVAKADGVTMAKVLPPGAKSPEQQFVSIMDAFDGVIEEADLNNADDCALLNNGVAGLLHKGFDVKGGGAGSFNTKGWDSSWNSVGVGREGGAFKPAPTDKDGNPVKESPEAKEAREANNQANLAKLKDMVGYFKNNASAHFGEGRHVAGRELAAVQTAGTVGQMLHDGVLGNDLGNGKLLQKHMEAQGLIPKDEGHNLGTIKKYRDDMRNSPLLAEVKNGAIQGQIGQQLKAGSAAHNQISSAVEKELARLDPENKISPEVRKAIAEGVADEVQQQVADMKPTSFKTGSRGRLPFNRNDARGDSGKALAGDKGMANSIAVSPHRGNDATVVGWTKDTFAGDEKVGAFFDAIEGDQNILKHGGSPRVPLRMGKGLAGEFVALTEGSGVLGAAVNRAVADLKDKGMQEEANLLSQVDTSGSGNVASEYKDAMNNIEVEFNGATHQKIPLGKFAHMPSVAGIMNENGVRTICSISGTTVDMTLATFAAIGPEKTKELLQPLMDHLNGKEGALDTPEGQQFKEFASSIGFFMQAGQYHTAGEVLGGLFIAGRAITAEGDSNTDIDETFAQFTNLMEQFSEDPSTFLAVSSEDAQKIKEGQGKLEGAIKEAETDRMILKKKQLARHGITGIGLQA